MDYCFDSNCFIEPWNNKYPIDLFPSLWNQFDELAQRGIVGAPREVRHEIEKVDDGLFEWFNQRLYMFHDESESVQLHVRELLSWFPRLIDTKKNRSMADPWVIALALDHDGTVVSDEKPAPGAKSPKIPDVCAAYKVRCITLLEFLRENDVKFQAG